jgi:hypothetical protein
MTDDRFNVLASCTECRWKFPEHKLEEVRLDDTKSKLEVAGKHALDHSKYSGHHVTAGEADDE